MYSYGVRMEFEVLAEARAKWRAANAKFQADETAILTRLLVEAVANRMSPEQISRISSMPVKRVRSMMRKLNLNPTNGRSVLADQAARTLADNARLLSVEPRDFDLTSPLAYLPMGADMKAALEQRQEFTETPDIEDKIDRLVQVFKKSWLAADARGEEGKRTEQAIRAVLICQIQEFNG